MITSGGNRNPANADRSTWGRTARGRRTPPSLLARPDHDRRGSTNATDPFIESFNGRLRDECLNIHLFWSLTHAKVTIGDWKEEYNHDRPHSSLGYRTPRAYAAICTH